MSKHETSFTQRYWKEQWENEGGTLIEEFPAVLPQGDATVGKRLLDGVIVLDGRGQHIGPKAGLRVDGKTLRRPKNGEHHDVTLTGQEVVVVQTKMGPPEKPYRLGMYLLGQAVFSKHLMERFHLKTIQSVAICGKGDRIMKELAKKYGIQVRVYEQRVRIKNGE